MTPDVVIVGSGINSLVCAVELGAKGRRVLVLEREAVAGGCIRTEEATVPGFRHEMFALSYPLFVASPFYARFSAELERRGVRFVVSDVATGVLTPDGRSLVLPRARVEAVAALEAQHQGDGAAYAVALAAVEREAALIFGLLGRPARLGPAAALLARAVSRKTARGVAAFAADALTPLRTWLDRDIGSEMVRALIAPWVLHVGLGPEANLSALMAKVIFYTLDAVGLPFVEGGGTRLVQALRGMVEDGGGQILTGVDVDEVIVRRGRAIGVRSVTGETFAAPRAVVCNVTPTQLHGRLLRHLSGPEAGAGRRRAQDYRYGPADMQIHLALSEPPRWRDPALGRVGLLHVTSGLDAVSRAVNEAARGLLPAQPTIVVGQPAAADPSCAPAGASVLWIQLQELPRLIRGDAAGEIDTPANGRWTDAVAQAYARRVLRQLQGHAPNLEGAIVGLRVMGPHELERSNINLVGGDPYSGACGLEQFHLSRPAAGGPRTPANVRRLHHIGASAHPGPGLGGVSGQLAAELIG